MITFTSTCPRQVNPINADPVRAKVIITLEIGGDEVKASYTY